MDLCRVLYHVINGAQKKRAFLSYFGSRGLLGRLLVRSLFSVPPDGRSGPEPGLIRLFKTCKKLQQLQKHNTYKTVQKVKIKLRY